MKILIISSMLFITTLFANYNYANETSGKIDMHGGKSDSLSKSKSPHFNMSTNSLSNQLKEKKELKLEELEEKNFKELKELGL